MSVSFFVLIAAPVVIGVVVGYLAGGRLRAVAGTSVRHTWLLWVAALLQALQYFADGVREGLEDGLGIPMLALVFAVVLIWLAVNLRHWRGAMRWAGGLVLAGAVLNGVVIAANGRMPYSVAAAELAGAPAVDGPKNVPAGRGSKLAFLGDVIPVPVVRKVASPGDALIGAGIVTLVVAAMRGAGRNPRREEVCDDPKD